MQNAPTLWPHGIGRHFSDPAIPAFHEGIELDLDRSGRGVPSIDVSATFIGMHKFVSRHAT